MDKFFNRQGSEVEGTLDEILSRFDLSSLRLQDSYDRLREEVAKLNGELERKNRQLKRNLKEKERAKNHLSSILESLPSGVVVVDKRGKITTFNREAELITAVTRDAVEGNDFNECLRRSFPIRRRASDTWGTA